MKKSILLLGLVAGLSVAPAAVVDIDLSPPGTDQAVGLSPANEVPAVTNSSGSGGEIFGGITFDTNSATLSFSVGYGTVAGFSNLTGPATGWLIQGPATVSNNGPTQIDLASHQLAAGNPTNGGILVGAVALNSAQTSNLLAGLLYLNITTAANTNGEIRGQLIAVTNTPPEITCPQPSTVECTFRCGATNTLAVEVSDANGDPLVVIWKVDGTPYQTNQVPASGPPTMATVLFRGHFAVGQHFVEVSVSDGKAEPVVCITSVTVVDTTPPVIRRIVATPSVLWPVNHKLVPVRLQVEAIDACACGPVTNRIVSVRSNEAVDARGSGHTAPDWQITGPLTVNLRAERSGRQGTRIYTITVESKDVAGNTARRSVDVFVPHDQRGH